MADHRVLRGVEIGPDEKVWLLDNKEWSFDGSSTNQASGDDS